MTHIDTVLLRALAIGGFLAGLTLSVISLIASDPSVGLRAIGPGLIGILALVALRRRGSVVPVLLVAMVVIATHAFLGRTPMIFTNALLAIVGLTIGVALLSRPPAAITFAAVTIGLLTMARLVLLDEAVVEVGTLAVVAFLVSVFGSQVLRWARREIGDTESRFKNLFDRSPVPTWEEDFSEAAHWLEALRTDGIQDLRTYLREQPDAAHYGASLIKIVRANEAAVDFVEAASEADLLGRLQPMTMVDDTLETVVEELVAIWEGKSWLKVDLRGRSLRGRPIDGYLLMAAPRSGETVDWTRVVVAMVDVTEVRNAKRQLEELVDSKDRFVASVSHELRTPLTAVIGLAEALRGDSRELIDGRERDELVDVIADQAVDVGYIVEDLLVAARADIGSVTIRSESVDVVEEIERLIGAVRQEKPEIRADHRVVAQADPYRLRQILRNLLTNAERYGGGATAITAAAANGHVSIEVRDRGPGIPEGLADHVFEPYQTAHQATGITGSVGLGLTVSRQLALLMGGDLTYERIDGETVFRLTVPTA